LVNRLNHRDASDLLDADINAPESDTQLSAWLAFLHAPGLSAAKRRLLLDTLGSIRTIVAISEPQARALRVTPETVLAMKRPSAKMIDQGLSWLSGAGRALITLGDARYPELLARAADAPVALFVEGAPERLAMPAIAIVGSRGATHQGAEFAAALAGAFSAAGLTVVSGLALGIDTAAHTGALIGPGSTAAVMATGLDRMYPKQNAALAARIIAEGGVVLSEMPLGTAPLPALFPQRNRIISGLSLGVVVVEASLQSGSLVTARFAGEQGREVFAVPGSIHNPMARGCHHLIRQGAKLVESARDVLSELAPLIQGDAAQLHSAIANTQLAKPKRRTMASPAPTQSALPLAPVDAETARFLDQMGYDPVSIDRLVDLTGMSIAALSAQLLTLELDGIVDKLSGARYQRAR
jgi:DNA processing protein